MVGSQDGGGNRTVTYNSRESATNKPLLSVSFTVSENYIIYTSPCPLQSINYKSGNDNN